MPDSTISNLSSLTGAGLAPNDIFALVDVSDTSMGAGGTNKKITRTELCTFDMGTITTSTPILNLAQTWNAGGVIFTGLKLNITDTASAAGSLLFDLQVGGVSKASVAKDGTLSASGTIATTSHLRAQGGGSVQIVSNSGALSFGATPDVFLYRDAANTLAQRNGTAAQAFNVYNTYTDASNYERGYARWNAGVYEFGMEALGTGAPKHVRLNRATGANLYLGDWNVNSSGHFLASVDNAYDIGASGANRPKNIYFGTQLIGSGQTVTASTPVLDLSQTWNNAAVAFTGFKLNVTSTASAAGSLLLDLQVAGSSRFTVDKAGGLVTASDAYFSGDLKGILNTSKITLGASSDVILARDAANTLAQRNGANAQTFNIYSTYTDASNYERLDVGFSAGAFRISAENAGTGAARSLTFGTANTDRWQIGGATGHFVASADNTYDIGASGANRPRNIYAGSDVYVGNGYAVKSPTKGSYSFGGGDGIHTLFNNAGTDFGRLQFGGTTSSFPALKRSGASLLVRLADDSGFGFFNAYVDSSNTTAVNSIGFRGVPQNIQNADYTFALTDSGLQVFHDEVSARTYTIPTNASVAFNIGSTITIVNNTGAGNIILTSADTIRRGDGVAGTGSRTIGPDSIVTLLKTKATEWMISGAFF